MLVWFLPLTYKKLSESYTYLIVQKLPFVKGQLISKCPFGFIASTKISTEKFENSALEWVGQNLSNFFIGILVKTMTPKGHFEIN